MGTHKMGWVHHKTWSSDAAPLLFISSSLRFYCARTQESRVKKSQLCSTITLPNFFLHGYTTNSMKKFGFNKRCCAVNLHLSEL